MFSRIVVIGKHIPKILGSIRKSYNALNPYIDEIKKFNEISTENNLKSNYPNKKLWEELSEYAFYDLDMKIGFTELPNEFIFKGKSVIFKYSIVCIEEMDKERISTAPSFQSSDEVIGVYESLGMGVNELADYLRKKYKIKCQSNHPLGGLVNFVPLAVKAGLGWFGHNGLLITPEYGQRQRIAMIFIEDKYFEFTDSDKHKWIETFCKSCRKCERNCPMGAIKSDKETIRENIKGFGDMKTSITKEKCYPQFNKTTGCGICMANCPFSKTDGTYEKLKKVILKSKELNN